MNTQKILIGALAGLALWFVAPAAANAQGRTAVMVDSSLDDASFLFRVKGKIQLGARIKIKDASPVPLLRYNVTNVRGFRLFVQAEADGLDIGGKGKKKKASKGKGKGGKGGLDGVGFGFGGEYLFRRNLSVVMFVSGGSFLNLQYYF